MGPAAAAAAGDSPRDCLVEALGGTLVGAVAAVGNVACPCSYRRWDHPLRKIEPLAKWTETGTRPDKSVGNVHHSDWDAAVRQGLAGREVVDQKLVDDRSWLLNLRVRNYPNCLISVGAHRLVRALGR